MAGDGIWPGSTTNYPTGCAFGYAQSLVAGGGAANYSCDIIEASSRTKDTSTWGWETCYSDIAQGTGSSSNTVCVHRGLDDDNASGTADDGLISLNTGILGESSTPTLLYLDF